jgi:polar amino acid transport system substrate-binding protein
MILTLSGCGRSENEIVLATEAGFAPYEYYENGEIVGVDIDIAREIAKELNKELIIKDIAFDSIIMEVKTGKSDFAAAGISYTEERAKAVSFSNDYAISKQIVIVNNNSDITNIEQIKNKKIAVQLGSVADTYVTEKFKKAQIVRQKKYLTTIQDLEDGKVDCVVMDELPALDILSKKTNMKILPESLVEDSYGIIVKKGNDDLLETVNLVIKRMQEDGSLKESILRHTSK